MNKIIDFSKSVIALAPLAGYTDLPFRSVVKKFGVDYTVSEMISSNALAYDSEKTKKMLAKSPNEDPFFIQLAGNKLDIMQIAIEKINEIDGIAGIDLNCGCPAPKVFNHGSGSNLLGDLPRLQEMLKTIKKYSNKQYTTCKIRIGVNEKIPLDIAKAIEDCGIDFIAVHGRTKKGAYKAAVDYDAIATIKQTVSIPVMANGDITDLAKAQYVLDYTKADGIMVGRGAIGKPWIFHQITSNNETISNELKKEIIIDHLKKMIIHYGDYGVVMFRKHLHTYSKSYDGANTFRDKVNHITSPSEMKELINLFF
jgi:tRNA-dihydrouridine synthase B